MFAWLIGHQPAVLFSHNKSSPAFGHQPANSTFLSQQISTSHRPPAASQQEKGKAVVPEKKRKTKEEKEWETAVNAAHAPEHPRRRLGIHIVDNPPSATQTSESFVPSSRTPGSEANPAGTLASQNRTRADVDTVQETDVDTVQETAQEIEDENSIRELILKSSCSVVTVGTVKTNKDVVETVYGTGFILVAEENYCLIFTSSLATGDIVTKYFVHFKEEQKRTEAHMLVFQQNKFSILLVKTDKKHAALIFDCDPLGYEIIHTVCAMAGSKLNANVNAPVIEEVEGFLGIYVGEVTAPTYHASDYSHRDVPGTENYFQIICDVHDDSITLENVDAEFHTANITVSSPVFRLNGKATGMIYQHGLWVDVKDGLFAKSIISFIQRKLNVKMWERKLKRMAEEMLVGLNVQ